LSAPKTNAARVLDRLGITYRVLTYDVDLDDLSATTVAAKVGVPESRVYKTLVARGDESGPILALVAADRDLDLKALARASGNRRAELVPLPEVQAITGYVRGGVTALAAKRAFDTYLDASATGHAEMAVSAGVRGIQLVLSPADYVRATGATIAAIATG
jgi:Cys-tRNA(Pro)/Cys-tRNA(Cys) deacylase